MYRYSSYGLWCFEGFEGFDVPVAWFALLGEVSYGCGTQGKVFWSDRSSRFKECCVVCGWIGGSTYLGIHMSTF